MLHHPNQLLTFSGNYHDFITTVSKDLVITKDFLAL